ncbi:hypothetical protein GIY11_08470 [Aerococcaceae bacterium DSM 109653]|uniref:Cell envelope-related transcriptional attenuator domain-containing protein n=1 Tax=Fundicoccus ignavus TaxID=2664442 RepID=A0A844C009_9LACT|nr:LCP family protein [Fundicoccus ignavus]MRI82036.1 hypothetical protein [Fundicoccus ignavus]
MKKYFTNAEGNFSYWKLIRNILVLLVLVTAAVAGKAVNDINETLNNVSQDVEIKSIRQTKVDIAEGDPINVLLIGTDGSVERTENNGDVNRSDTLILVSLNPQTKSTKLLSIPRDAMTLIDGVDTPDKINHAYAFGGAQLTIETVQDFLDVPIDYYAVINMDGLTELIDAIGGIEVTSPLTFEYRGTGFVEGETREVNGLKAMNFARMRYDDPEGEVGRQNRQKIVIKAVIDKVLALDTLTTYPEILKVVASNVQTNVDLTNAVSIAQDYIPALENISSISFESLEDMYLDEIFYFYIPLNSRVKVANEIRQHSGLAPIGFADLIDPIGENGSNATKTLSIILNQYPSGLTSEQLAKLQSSQDSLQSIRENEYNTVPVAPTYPESSYVPPTSSVPEVPNPEPSQPVEPVEPIEPIEPPVESEVPNLPEPPVEPEVPQVPSESVTPPTAPEANTAPPATE